VGPSALLNGLQTHHSVGDTGLDLSQATTRPTGLLGRFGQVSATSRPDYLADHFVHGRGKSASGLKHGFGVSHAPFPRAVDGAEGDDFAETEATEMDAGRSRRIE
jgi:hypothetical protein